MQQPTVKLSRIRRGNNPRKFFDPVQLAERTASIAVHGVLQPVLVRPVEGDPNADYELVAGEYRYRGAWDAHGPEYDMPVTIRVLTDEEAANLALIENIQRAEMAPSEEAIAAATAVGKLKGDRDEAARILGWSRATLDKRLALMNCSTAVLEALTPKTINLGHAELLATLPKDKQDLLLPVIISEKKSVAELKKTIEAAACNLAAAIFDKADCATCSHNSSLQSEMFAEAIATGSCTNRGCFNEKTEKRLDTLAYGLKDEYPVIRIIRAGDNHTRVQLVADGPTGVGEAQAKACHACESFGVAVSGLPDSIGKIFRGQCFDPSCNQKMVAARLKAERDAKSPGGKSSAGAGTTPTSKGEGKPAHKEPEATRISESERVKVYRHSLWRKALRREVGSNPEVANHYLIAAAMTGLARNITADHFGKIFEKVLDEKPASELSKNLGAVADVALDKRQMLTVGLAVAAIDGMETDNLTCLCKFHQLDLRQYWNLQKSKDFLEMLTKSEMKVLADELGIRKALGDGFAKLFNKSKPEVIDGLLAVEGFDYHGKIPKVLCF
ncbi:PRTRC system ParB family protein [Cupriavidus basilensis]|uniref:PRTRC system ParB family protein n=1 Tax=Cupriavidus basilensis TaxID=68895 RepID=UPI000750B298|nr:PRTRC system ParB family protein [Cupriavidus basilensis]